MRRCHVFRFVFEALPEIHKSKKKLDKLKFSEISREDLEYDISYLNRLIELINELKYMYADAWYIHNERKIQAPPFEGDISIRGARKAAKTVKESE